jgi:uncharacterized membrane protein
MKRIPAIDTLRGIVVVIMTLDHTRDLMHYNPLELNPTDLSTTTVWLFLTRWVTHLCAPSFVFLAGTSAYLSSSLGESEAELRLFLFKRGLWLIFVNFTINNFGIFFDLHFSVLFAQVIAVIGFGLIALGVLLSLSVRTIGMIGISIIAGHNLLQGVFNPSNQIMNIGWTYLMSKGYFQLTPNTGLLISYAIIPWTGILFAGYGFGSILTSSTAGESQRVLLIGLFAVFAFLILRYINLYGDPSPWSSQKDTLFTILSFINTTKQPPSLLFALMTLSLAIILLYVFSTVDNRCTRSLAIYGKVPLFYWLVHWYVLHIIALVYYWVRGYHLADLQFMGMGFGRPANGDGMPLWQIYLTWIVIVLLLYPAMKWFGSLKMKYKSETWVKYL